MAASRQTSPASVALNANPLALPSERAVSPWPLTMPRSDVPGTAFSAGTIVAPAKRPDPSTLTPNGPVFGAAAAASGRRSTRRLIGAFPG